MKKIATFFLILAISLSCTFALTAAQEKAEIKTKIAKLRQEINRLTGLKLTTSSKARIAKLVDLIEGHQARIEKLVERLAEIEKEELSKQREVEEKMPEHMVEEAKEEVIEEVVAPAPATPEGYVLPILKPPEIALEAKPGRVPWLTLEIGTVAGLFSASTGAFGEIRLPMRYVVGPATSSFRLAGGLAQSEDMSRRYAPIQIDAILNFPAGYFTGVENYLGAGLNYVVLTSGMKPGSIGGQMFYGVESTGFGGKLFGELGYGILRTGFTPSHRGITAMVGYRRQWIFY
jgi:hypothetical protein